jgi:hypothetical protein
MTSITTEHGPAVTWWDERTDSWVLSYPLVNQQFVDQPLPAGNRNDLAAAVSAAVAFLADQEIGAGRKLLLFEAAALTSRLSAQWRDEALAGLLPAPDGAFDDATPWWWETTILRMGVWPTDP